MTVSSSISHLASEACRNRILQSLEFVLGVSTKATDKPANLSRIALISSRQLCISLALKAVSRRQITTATKLAIICEIAGNNSIRLNRAGHWLKRAGSFDAALLFFGAAVQHAKDKTECEKSVFDLGHCAKVAGHYALACECFAFIRRLTSPDLYRRDESQDELEHSLAMLTTCFRNGEMQQLGCKN